MSVFSERKKDMAVMYIGVFVIVLMQSLLSDHINALKHSALAFVFVVPFAASGLYNLLMKKLRLQPVKVVIAVMLVALVAFSFVSGTSSLENFFPDERNVSQVINSLVSPGDRVLIHGSSYRYYSFLNFSDIVTNFYFDYNGDNISSAEDYEEAVRDGYFAAILISNIRPSIPADPLSGPYTLYYEENQTISSGIVPLRIYLRNSG